MVLQNSDDDTCDKFELPRDHEKMRKILQEYEELLTACLAEIERFGEEFFFSNVLVNGKSIEPSMCIKLANEARHIMAFIKKETEGKVCGRLNLKIKSLSTLTKYISSYFGGPLNFTNYN